MADFGTDTDDDWLALELASGKNIRTAAAMAIHQRTLAEGMRQS